VRGLRGCCLVGDDNGDCDGIYMMDYDCIMDNY
jgi:hypothetical protein